MKKFLLSLSLGVSAASAQDLAIDPPLTKDEKRALKDMREQWEDAHMPAMTAEQELAMIKNMRDMQVRMMGQAMGMRRAIESGALQAQVAGAQPREAESPQVQETATPSVTREDLASAYEQRLASTQFTRFERKGDGFLANGRVFIDINGKVKQFGADPMTGRVTYFVDIGNGDLLVKHHNINSDLDPILIGRIALRGDRADFRAVSGETAGGESVVPVSDGLIVTRRESIARYSIGRGAKAFAVPEGFTVAAMQNGDVSGTGYVLIERIPQDDDSFKEIGKTVGHLFGKRDDTQDYALLQIETGKTIALFLSDDGKSVGQGTGCVRQNDFVNKCSGWHSWESIWETDGRPNYSHYFWSLTWVQTKFGPLAIAKEDGTREVNVIALDSGERFNAFKRKLGILWFAVEQKEDGGLSLEAQLAFKRHQINDVGQVLDGSLAAAATKDD